MTDYTYSDLFPSRFLKADDVSEEGLTLTIKDISIEELGQDKQPKPVLHFKETDKGLALNKTNGEVLHDLYGEPYEWAGKRISLYVTEVAYGGKTTLGIRVRKRVPQPRQQLPQAPTGGEPEPPPPWEE